MIAVNGATLLILGAVVTAALYGLRNTPRARHAATPIVFNQPHPCHLCRRDAHHLAERRDTGMREWTCPGCLDTGTVRGYWADRTEIAL